MLFSVIGKLGRNGENWAKKSKRQAKQIYRMGLMVRAAQPAAEGKAQQACMQQQHNTFFPFFHLLLDV